MRKVPGQQINQLKTKMAFSKNLSLKQRKQIMKFWDAPKSQQKEKYLDLHLWLEKIIDKCSMLLNKKCGTKSKDEMRNH